MKMYICIKSSTPVGMAMNAAAHAGLMCYLKYKDTPNMQMWLAKSFKKVTCAVSDAEFHLLKTLPDHIVVTESRLDNAELAIVLAPRPESDFPEWISMLRLWK